MPADVSMLVYTNTTLFILFYVHLFLITKWIALMGLGRVHPLPCLSDAGAVVLWEKCHHRESLEICAVCLARLIRSEALRWPLRHSEHQFPYLFNERIGLQGL